VTQPSEPSGFTAPHVRVATSTGFVPFLADIGEEGWRLLAHACTQREFAAGEFIMRAGERDRSLAIVHSGNLGFFLNPEDVEPRRVMAAPTIVGEVCFFDGQPRSGTVRALAAGELWTLPFASFKELAAAHPALGHSILLDAGCILAHRLRYDAPGAA
jgi:CRP-like cAMP-binding protein